MKDNKKHRLKYSGIFILILGLSFISCNQDGQTTKTTENIKVTQESKDKEEIQSLIRQVLAWSNSKNSIDLFPNLSNNKDSIYVGFDVNKHKENLEKLRETNFFATEFIDNYNHIILTIDRKLKNKEYDEWHVGDLPTFIFASDVDPWCLCHDIPYDKPSPWDFLEIEIISLDNNKGELDWTWGKLELNTDLSWKEFKYRFRVSKENNKWKIAYLKGFDFIESTRADGQL